MVPTDPTSKERKDVFSIRMNFRDLIKDVTSGGLRVLRLLTVGNSFHIEAIQKFEEEILK